MDGRGIGADGAGERDDLTYSDGKLMVDSPEMNDIPKYHITSTVNGKVVGEFMKPIADPFVWHTVIVGWRDILRGLFQRRLVVEVMVGGDSRTVERVLELNPDFLGGLNSPSRKAWNAALNTQLGSL